jgi:ABC-type multidrug transport system permease subunit
MTISAKGLFLFAFSIAMFNIGLTLNSVDKDTVTVVSILLGIFVGPYFISGKIFEGEEEIND